MSEALVTSFAIDTRAALAGLKTGRLGARNGEPGIALTPLPEGHVLHVLAKPFDAAGESRAKALAERLGAPLRLTAPGQWYVAGDRVLGGGELKVLSEEFADLAVSDQSHGRVRIAVSGRNVEAMLAKLMAADLSLAAFPVGNGTTLFAGHVSVHAARMEAESFELMVLRGFAVDLHDTLVQASLEFGVECRQPA